MPGTPAADATPAPGATPADGAGARLRVRAPRRVVLAGAAVPVRCVRAGGAPLARCRVRVVTRIGGRTVVLARGRASAAAPRHALRVAARVIAAGRAAAPRPGGVRARVLARAGAASGRARPSGSCRRP